MQEWKYTDNKFQLMIQIKCVVKPLDSLVSEWGIALTHINIKQIQSTQFQVELEKKLYDPFLWMEFNSLKAFATLRRQFSFPNVCLLQTDFAMSYSCEYQMRY